MYKLWTIGPDGKPMKLGEYSNRDDATDFVRGYLRASWKQSAYTENRQYFEVDSDNSFWLEEDY